MHRHIVQRCLRFGLACAILSLTAGCATRREQATPPAPGRTAPPLALSLLDGGVIQLADLKGRVVIVNFWASWCAPCVEETPRLVDWYEQHHAAGLDVLGVNTLYMDSREAVTAFVNAYRVPYPVAVDEDGEVTELWLARQLPRSYVIDREGIVRFVRIGELTEDDFTAQVAPLLP